MRTNRIILKLRTNENFIKVFDGYCFETKKYGHYFSFKEKDEKYPRVVDLNQWKPMVYTTK